MKRLRSSILCLLALLMVCSLGFGDQSARTKMVILPSTDTSTFQIAPALQNALVTLIADENLFDVSATSEVLSGFTETEVRSLFSKLGASHFSFALLEQNRISVFIFSQEHPSQFIASSQLFNQGTELEGQLRKAVNEALTSLRAETFKNLPGTVSKSESNSRDLFRELSSITDSSTYLGAQIGMARLSNRQDNTSTVVFGVSIGHQFSPQWGAETGISVSSYLIGSVGARYYIPIMEKVVKLSVGFDLASVLGTVSQNSTFNSDPKFSYSPNIRTGSILAGPGVFFDIPLLGAALRGDLRFYTGSSTVLVGTYGFIYYL